MFYRSDRNSKGGGVAILIKNNIKHYVKQFNLQMFKTLFNKDLLALTNFKDKTIIMGDFNARHIAWNCLTINAKGKTLLNFCLKKIIIAAPKEATHFPKRGAPSILDIFLLKNVKNYSEPISICGLSSDQNPISIMLTDLINPPAYRDEISRPNEVVTVCTETRYLS